MKERKDLGELIKDLYDLQERISEQDIKGDLKNLAQKMNDVSCIQDAIDIIEGVKECLNKK